MIPLAPFFAAILPGLADRAAGIVGDVIDRVLPEARLSDAERAAIDREVRNEMMQRDLRELEADVTLAAQQTGINKVEAANSSIFVAGWRPFIGWICGSALAFQFILAPLARLPTLDVDQLVVVLLGMLGLGGLRTHEKVKGVA